MPSRWRDERRRFLSPETTAYHEAGHVVVAYEVGWRVRRGGARPAGPTCVCSTIRVKTTCALRSASASLDYLPNKSCMGCNGDSKRMSSRS